MFIFLGKHLQRGFMKTQLHFFSFAWPKERTSRLKVSTVVNVILSPRKVNFTIDTKYLVIGFWNFCHILSQFCHLSNLKNRINPKIDFMNSHKYTSDIILTNPTLLFFLLFHHITYNRSLSDYHKHFSIFKSSAHRMNTKLISNRLSMSLIV